MCTTCHRKLDINFNVIGRREMATDPFLDKKARSISITCLCRIGVQLSVDNGVTGWRRLAEIIGFSREDTDRFFLAEPQNPAKYMLQEWSRQEEATVRALRHNLNEMKRQDVVKVLDEDEHETVPVTIVIRKLLSDGRHSTCIKAKKTASIFEILPGVEGFPGRGRLQPTEGLRQDIFDQTAEECSGKQLTFIDTEEEDQHQDSDTDEPRMSPDGHSVPYDPTQIPQLQPTLFSTTPAPTQTPTSTTPPFIPPRSSPPPPTTFPPLLRPSVIEPPLFIGTPITMGLSVITPTTPTPTHTPTSTTPPFIPPRSSPPPPTTFRPLLRPSVIEPPLFIGTPITVGLPVIIPTTPRTVPSRPSPPDTGKPPIPPRATPPATPAHNMTHNPQMHRDTDVPPDLPPPAPIRTSPSRTRTAHREPPLRYPQHPLTSSDLNADAARQIPRTSHEGEDPTRRRPSFPADSTCSGHTRSLSSSRPNSGSDSDPGSTFALNLLSDESIHLTTIPGFHGQADTDEKIKRLFGACSQKENGMFILRPSRSEPAEKCISTWFHGEIVNYRIHRDVTPNTEQHYCYIYHDRIFQSLVDLVQFYRDHCLIDGPFLTRPI